MQIDVWLDLTAQTRECASLSGGDFGSINQLLGGQEASETGTHFALLAMNQTMALGVPFAI